MMVDLEAVILDLLPSHSMLGGDPSAYVGASLGNLDSRAAGERP